MGTLAGAGVWGGVGSGWGFFSCSYVVIIPWTEITS